MPAKEKKKNIVFRAFLGTLPGWIIAGLAVVTFFQLFPRLGDLATKNELGEMGKNVEKTVANTIVRAIQESTQEYIQFQIDYKRDPTEARNNIFKESFRQAEERGYVTRTLQGYRIADKYTQGNNNLLTYFERQLVGEVLSANEDKDKMDLLELTLSEFRGRDIQLERNIETSDYGLIYLLPFDKIAVIGGLFRHAKNVLASRHTNLKSL